MNTKNSSSSKTGSGTTESGKDRGSAAEAAKDASAPAQAGGPAMATVVDVTSADLKSRFVAGSIPLQQDFGNLIDIAECGRRAVGQSKDQTDNNVGAGLALASDAANIGKLSVKPAPSDGIKVDDGGLKIRRGGCITVDSNGIAVKAGNGIDGSSDYVCVKAGYGIVVDSSGVSIDSKTVLPKGMIMMFCGSTIPQGWVVCDGGSGTPDLRGRFILGGVVADVGGENGKSVSGDKNNKVYSQTSTAVKTGIDVNIDDCTLTIEQIPSHSHWSGTKRTGPDDLCDAYGYHTESFSTNMTLAANVFETIEPGNFYQVTSSSTGGGKPHSHPISVTEDSHAHAVDIVPPYYILVFIMKT